MCSIVYTTRIHVTLPMNLPTLENFARLLVDQSSEHAGVHLTEQEKVSASSILLEDLEQYMREYLLSHLSQEEIQTYIQVQASEPVDVGQSYLQACLPNMEEIVAQSLLDFASTYSRQ